MLKKLFLKIYFTIEKNNNINCSQEGIFVVKMSATHHVWIEEENQDHESSYKRNGPAERTQIKHIP